MQIDIKEISKIKVEPDELLIITLAPDTTSIEVDQLKQLLEKHFSNPILLDKKGIIVKVQAVKMSEPVATNLDIDIKVHSAKELEPELKEWEIWCEGYGHHQHPVQAFQQGTHIGYSFRDACSRYYVKLAGYDHQALTFNGRKLFDNEADARKAFG